MPRENVPNDKLSEAAKQDLLDIAQYGDEQFGPTQSDRYRDKLKNQFSMLALAPSRYPNVAHIRDGYRRCCRFPEPPRRSR